MFCLGGESLDRVSNRGPISGDPSNGPRSDLKRGGGEIRQIALSGLATSKWIKLRSAIDSSHASFDRSTRAISLFRACLTACPRLFLSVLRHGSKSIRLFIELKVAVYIVKISTKNRRRRYNHEKCDVVEISAEAFSRQDFQRCWNNCHSCCRNAPFLFHPQVDGLSSRQHTVSLVSNQSAKAAPLTRVYPSRGYSVFLRQTCASIPQKGSP